MFCRTKRLASPFSPAPATADKKAKKSCCASHSGGGLIGRAIRAYKQRRAGRRRGLQVASEEDLGPMGYPLAETEKQWLVHGEDMDGAKDAEGRGLVRAAAPPAYDI